MVVSKQYSVCRARGRWFRQADPWQVTGAACTPDREYSIETVSCLGCCSLAPAIVVNDETYGRLDSKKLLKLVKEYQRNEQKSTASTSTAAESEVAEVAQEHEQ